MYPERPVRYSTGRYSSADVTGGCLSLSTNTLLLLVD